MKIHRSPLTAVVRAADTYGRALLGGLVLVALYLASLYSYLLFHTLVEVFGIVVAVSIFIVAWNTRHLYDNSYLLVVGIASAFIAGLGLLHALAYKGMQIFPGYDANLPTQLWIAMRGLLGLTLLVAPLLLGRRVRAHAVVATYAAATALLLLSIFVWRNFPAAYVDGVGGHLTTFKIHSEYAIAFLMLGGMALLWQRRDRFDRGVLRSLTAAVAISVLAEIAFTEYASVYGRANLVGHLLMVTSYYFFYAAIVETALARPFRLLFRELKQRETELEAAQQAQEQMTEFLVHDLRSPLTAVTAAISTLRSDRQLQLQEVHQQLLGAASASSAWLLTLITALLDSSRLESGALPLSPRPYTVRELVLPALQQVSLWAELGNIELQTALGEESLQVVADHEVTVRILVNVLSNALKYSRPGLPIAIGAEPQQAAVTFSVKDHGPGIAAEWADKVFERFTIGPRKAGVAASGLGLHFCKLAVEAQGGRIWLTSTPGEGTAVSFTLPLAPKGQEEASRVAPREAAFEA